MASKQEQILNHIIDIKVNVGGIEEHLKTLNGSVERHQKEIDERQDASLNNSFEINRIKIKMAKWAGGAVVIMGLINIIIMRVF